MDDEPDEHQKEARAAQQQQDKKDKEETTDVDSLLEDLANYNSLQEARITKLENVLKEVSSATYQNIIRLIKHNNPKSVKLKEWHESIVPKVVAALPKEVVLIREHRFALELVYRELHRPREHADKLRSLLQKLGVEKEFVLTPPYDPHQNMQTTPVQTLYYSIMAAVEAYSGKRVLDKKDKPVATYPLKDVPTPEFSMSYNDHCFVRGSFVKGALHMEMESTFMVADVSLKASEVLRDFRIRYTSSYVLKAKITGASAQASAGLTPAPKRSAKGSGAKGAPSSSSSSSTPAMAKCKGKSKQGFMGKGPTPPGSPRSAKAQKIQIQKEDANSPTYSPSPVQALATLTPVPDGEQQEKFEKARRLSLGRQTSPDSKPKNKVRSDEETTHAAATASEAPAAAEGDAGIGGDV